VIEWALRRFAAAEHGVELRAGAQVDALLVEDGRRWASAWRAARRFAATSSSTRLGRYRTPAGWPRAGGEPTDSGAIYYCRYFRLVDGVDHMPAPLLNPARRPGLHGVQHLPGRQPDVRRDRARAVRRPRAARPAPRRPRGVPACAAIRPLDVMTSEDHGVPITDVLPMGGLMNVDRSATRASAA
jgi:hypothetical protein